MNGKAAAKAAPSISKHRFVRTAQSTWSVGDHPVIMNPKEKGSAVEGGAYFLKAI
jgi:hypothetical protein